MLVFGLSAFIDKNDFLLCIFWGVHVGPWKSRFFLEILFDKPVWTLTILMFANYLLCSSFVFLQLFHSAYFGNTSERPLALSNCQMVQRAFKNLDRIPPYETHKVHFLFIQLISAYSDATL